MKKMRDEVAIAIGQALDKVWLEFAVRDVYDEDGYLIDDGSSAEVVLFMIGIKSNESLKAEFPTDLIWDSFMHPILIKTMEAD